MRSTGFRRALARSPEKPVDRAAFRASQLASVGTRLDSATPAARRTKNKVYTEAGFT